MMRRWKMSEALRAYVCARGGVLAVGIFDVLVG